MTIISNPSADKEEKIEHAAKILRSSKQAKQVFIFVYTGKKHFKSIKDIRKGIPEFNKNTYKAAARLAAEDVVDKKNENGMVFYGKKEFYTYNQRQILRLSENARRLKEYPTKRKFNGASQKNTFVFRTNFPRPRQLTIDNIDSFSKIKNFFKGNLNLVNGMAERTINHGICQILNETEKKDWGGERNDIFSTHVILKGKRFAAAFALKAKGIRGILVPSGMGKNGDQIPRLFEGTARVHFVVHNNTIHESIYDMMLTHAIQKSIETGEDIYYCIIDGRDLSRLINSYPDAFPITIQGKI